MERRPRQLEGCLAEVPDGPRCVSGRRAAICRRERGLLGIDMECDPVGSAQRLMATPDAEEFLRKLKSLVIALDPNREKKKQQPQNKVQSQTNKNIRCIVIHYHEKFVLSYM